MNKIEEELTFLKNITVPSSSGEYDAIKSMSNVLIGMGWAQLKNSMVFVKDGYIIKIYDDLTGYWKIETYNTISLCGFNDIVSTIDAYEVLEKELELHDEFSKDSNGNWNVIIKDENHIYNVLIFRIDNNNTNRDIGYTVVSRMTGGFND